MMRCAAYFAVISLAGTAAGQTSQGRAVKGALSAAEQSAAIENVREYARRYIASLPNYTCTQLTQQTITAPAAVAGGPPGAPMQNDVIEEQISFLNGREIRTVTKINDGRPSAAERARTRALSDGEFGSLLDTIFKPQSGADIRWTRATSLNGQRVYLFAYRVPQSSGYVLVGSKGQTRVPFEGLVYADRQTGAIIRIEMKCTGIPSNFEFKSVNLTLDYKSERIADREYLLPSGFNIRYETTGSGTFIDARYKSCHRFSADTTVTFAGDSGGTGVAVAQPDPQTAPGQAGVAQQTTVAENAAAAEVKQDAPLQPLPPDPLREPAPPAIAVPPVIVPPPIAATVEIAEPAPPNNPVATTAAAPDSVFRTSARLVQLSVIAQDKDGKPITDLRRDEFQIFDNGAPQEIRLFLADHPEPSAPAPQAPTVFTNRIGSGGSSVLLFDRLIIDNENSEFKSNARARQEALRALNAIPQGERIAIYSLGCRFQVVREFTSDRDSLLEQLNAFAPGSSSCANSAVPGHESARDTPEEAALKAQMLTHEREGFNDVTAYRQTQLGESEFQAMADHLAGIPGRKNLIWVTSQFQLSPASLKRLIDANVAIYPVDATGSMVGTPAEKKARYDALRAFAAMTGGIAFYGRDDFDAGIREAIRDGLVSYTLGFYPASDGTHAPVHQLSVRVGRPGVTLRYRTSYELKPQPPASANPVDDLVQALNRPVDATIIPVTADATLNGNRVDLSVSIDVPSLDLELSEGIWKGKAELVIRFVTADGLPAGDVSAQTLTFNLRPATYESMLKEGDPYRSHNELPIPAKATELKVLVGSLASGKIGTLTIPLSEVGPLPSNRK